MFLVGFLAILSKCVSLNETLVVGFDFTIWKNKVVRFHEVVVSAETPGSVVEPERFSGQLDAASVGDEIESVVDFNLDFVVWQAVNPDGPLVEVLGLVLVVFDFLVVDEDLDLWVRLSSWLKFDMDQFLFGSWDTEAHLNGLAIFFFANQSDVFADLVLLAVAQIGMTGLVGELWKVLEHEGPFVGQGSFVFLTVESGGRVLVDGADWSVGINLESFSFQPGGDFENWVKNEELPFPPVDVDVLARVLEWSSPGTFSGVVGGSEVWRETKFKVDFSFLLVSKAFEFKFVVSAWAHEVEDLLYQLLGHLVETGVLDADINVIEEVGLGGHVSAS